VGLLDSATSAIDAPAKLKTEANAENAASWARSDNRVVTCEVQSAATSSQGTTSAIDMRQRRASGATGAMVPSWADLVSFILFPWMWPLHAWHACARRVLTSKEPSGNAAE
jgi:hypothetical protein